MRMRCTGATTKGTGFDTFFLTLNCRIETFLIEWSAASAASVYLLH